MTRNDDVEVKISVLIPVDQPSGKGCGADNKSYLSTVKLTTVTALVVYQ